jgi:endonuclease-3
VASRPPRSGAEALTRRLAVIAHRLSGAYGLPRRRRSEPLDELIATILSQNTSDLNSTRAFHSLKAAFPDWAAAARARPPAVEKAIRVGGLARIKSRRILQVLSAVRRREGGYDLRHWRRLDPLSAEQRLKGLPGVGPKTRACVLLFACGHPAFPVDTHVHRIVRRLGLVPDGAGAERAHAHLAPAVPGDQALGLHLNLIRLGREVCRPRAPRCGACPLRRLCPHARRVA